MDSKNRIYGHRKMIVWQNLDKIELMVRTRILAVIPKSKFSLFDQLDRACSSAVANFIEGYYSGSIKEYLRFLSYSRRSLAELQDWVRRSYYNRLIDISLWQEFEDLSIRTLYLHNRLTYSLKQKINKK
jgi:four helix bundle protein